MASHSIGQTRQSMWGGEGYRHCQTESILLWTEVHKQHVNTDQHCFHNYPAKLSEQWNTVIDMTGAPC